MKLKKYFISFITIITFLFTNVVSAATTAPDSFNINGKDTKGIDGSQWGTPIRLTYKQTSDGKPIYCLDLDKETIQGNIVLKFERKEELSTRHAYVLANGYPNKKITGDNTKDYYITALAIWYLEAPDSYVLGNFDFNNGTFKGKENEIAKEVGKLIKGANNYTYTKPTMKINISNNELSLSSDGKYYVSTNIGVNTTGIVGNYKVSLDNAPKNTVVTDVNGNSKNEFATNEKFIVKVPVSSIDKLTSEFKVNVSATGSTYKAYKYAYLDGKSQYQNVTALYPENEDLKADTTLKLDFVTEVQISKIDVTDGKELPGATLTVKDSNGKVVDTWVSTNEVHIIKGIEPGKYTLTEEIAPDGYILSTETVEFEVKLDNTVTKVSMKNAPTEVQISKIDVTDGKELPGAKLTVKDSEGEVIDTWVSTNEVHVIKGLKVGKYTLTEEIAPEGYVLSTETVEFEVKNDGTVTKVTMKNAPEDKKPIYVSKKDITTGEELEGAHLEIKDVDGNLVIAWVSTTEPFMIEELKPGKYYLSETLAPLGYELTTEVVEFVVKEDGTVDGDIVMYNKPETVPVPNTASFKTITSSLIGIIIIGIGTMIIYKNYKKNEEY